MIELISDHPVMLSLLERVPNALIKYCFVPAVGKRHFFGPWTLLNGTSNEALLARIEEYKHADEALKELSYDIHRRLGYSFEPYCYRVGQPINSGFSPSDRAELLKLQSALNSKLNVQAAITTELLRVDQDFQTLAHVEERGENHRNPLSCVHRMGWIWASRRNLTDEQWIGIIDQKRSRDEAVLNVLAAATRPLQGDQSRLIPIDVRREVWRRDEGKCVNCGSQERLEFDHIIPFSLGGSNTARNVQLLCEICNRDKGATLG